MSERLETTETEEVIDAEGSMQQEAWATGEHYSYMKVDAGSMGNALYYSLPTFTILTQTQEELETINDEFSAILSKYTDQIIVGAPHEASLVLSLNQASADLAQQKNVIEFLREKIKEVTGSYEAAGDWEEPS